MERNHRWVKYNKQKQPCEKAKSDTFKQTTWKKTKFDEYREFTRKNSINRNILSGKSRTISKAITHDLLDKTKCD